MEDSGSVESSYKFCMIFNESNTCPTLRKMSETFKIFQISFSLIDKKCHISCNFLEVAPKDLLDADAEFTLSPFKRETVTLIVQEFTKFSYFLCLSFFLC